MLRQHETVTEDHDANVPRADLAVYAGSGFELTLDVVDVDGDPVDLTGRTVRSQIRRYPGADELAAEFTVDLVDAAAGRVILTLSPADTTPLVGIYAYDIKWQDPTPTPLDPTGTTSFFVAGRVGAEAEVTRPS
jgi:hypothetical protein